MCEVREGTNHGGITQELRVGGELRKRDYDGIMGGIMRERIMGIHAFFIRTIL